MSRQRRVLHLVDSMKLGGVQTLLAGVLPALAEAEIDVRLAALHGPGPFSEIFAERGLEPVHLASSRLDPVLPFRLRKLLSDAPVDILHTHGVPSCWLGERASGLGYVPRLVQHVHHLNGGQHGQPLQNALERFAYRRGDCLVACSQAVADSFDRELPKRVVYNGIDTGHFEPPSPAQREAARSGFGFLPEDYVLCMTGRITRKKGVLHVCEVLGILVDTYPHLRLVVSGTGPDAAAVRDCCDWPALRGKIVMTGFLDDVRPCLHAADTYVMASAVEGLGSALLEAMATGLPALVSDYPAAREVVEDDMNARIFSPDKQGSLEKILRRHLEDDRKRRCAMGERARTTIVERFSLTRTVSELTALYREL
jgi:glycosyltransferase involved in cell wall biosynthesis